MNVVVKFCIRNPDWHEGMNEKDEQHIPKYSHSSSFKFPEKVIDCATRETNSYELTIVAEDETNSETSTLGTVLLEDVHVTEFRHGEESTPVVISNEIIHEVVTTQKENGKLYWYYFLKENVDILNLECSIWLSASHRDQLLREVPGLALV